MSTSTLSSSTDSPPEKQARLEPTNFGQHESRNSNFTSSPWKGPSSSPVQQQQQQQQQQLCRSSSFPSRDESPNHLSRAGGMKTEPRNLIVTPDMPAKEFSNRESPSSIEARRSESIHDEFDEHRRRHDESTFFAGLDLSNSVLLRARNTKGGSVTVLLTSCLTGLY
jgi:hypothetical protein